jgi:hypothetical protein
MVSHTVRKGKQELQAQFYTGTILEGCNVRDRRGETIILGFILRKQDANCNGTGQRSVTASFGSNIAEPQVSTSETQSVNYS